MDSRLRISATPRSRSGRCGSGFPSQPEGRRYRCCRPRTRAIRVRRPGRLTDRGSAPPGGSGEGPVVLRKDGVPNATPHWSPRNDWITWETEQGFVLVSPDGGQQRVLSDDQWLVHTWSRDGSEVFGIRESENLH